METVTLNWNVTNWITVFLMTVLGWAVLGLVAQLWKNSPLGSGGSSASAAQ